MLAASLAAGSLPAAEPDERSDRIARLVRDLDDERFAARQAASKQLTEIGRPALEALRVAACSASPEVADRAHRVLVRLLGSTNEEARHEAERVLFELTSSPQLGTAARARAAMRPLALKIAAELTRAGAWVTVDDDGAVVVNIDKTENPAPLMPLIRRLPGLTDISASNRKVDDKCLAHLAGHPTLKYLNLFESGIGDEGIKVFKTLPALRSVPMGDRK